MASKLKEQISNSGSGSSGGGGGGGGMNNPPNAGVTRTVAPTNAATASDRIPRRWHGYDLGR